eukprot:1157297-Amorphochlora_amoeboformis.AAC.1
MGTTTRVLRIDCVTKAPLGWLLWIDCMTLRDFTLCHVSSKLRYYRVLPDTTNRVTPMPISLTGYYWDCRI